jgi:hypothetical protein
MNNYIHLNTFGEDDINNENNPFDLSSYKDYFIPCNDFLFPNFSYDNSLNILSKDISENKTQAEIKKFKNSDNKDVFLISPKVSMENDKEKNNENIIPAQYKFDKLKELIQNLNLPSKVKEAIVMDSNLNKIDKEMCDKKLFGKKRRRKGKIKFKEDPAIQKVGRKKQNDLTKRKHDRNSADNIIKKIKLKFLEYSLKFLNNILKANLDKRKFLEYYNILRKNRKKKEEGKEKEKGKEIEIEKQHLLKFLDYKFIDKIKKETDLMLLNMPLKEVFSKDISPKYSTLSSDSNRKIIERILEDEKDNINIMFAFNLTLGEWIDIFTYKKKLTFFQNFDGEKMKDFQGKFDMVEDLILEIYKKNYSHNYLSYFISYVYNYKRWFIFKKGRNRVSNKILKENC